MAETDMGEAMLINISATRGGQEAYIHLLEQGLSERAGPRLTPLRFSRLGQALAALWSRHHDAPGSDRVYVLNGNRALFASLLAPWRGARRIYIQHSQVSDRQAGRLRPLIRRGLMRLALRGMDAVIRVCDAVFPETLAPGRVFTVHNGVDPRMFPCRAYWRADANAPARLLMVGALTRNKNQGLALEILARLDGARLVLLGEGPERAALERRARELGVADRVTWAGQQADPAPYYRAADFTLVLSAFEGLPFAALESMASGTPVVGFPVGGLPEAIEDGADGVLVGERSAGAVAAALADLAADPARLQAMGLAARRKIEARFTQRHMVEGFLRVLEATRQRKGRT